MSQITASRMTLQLFKQKILAAKKGHELLKRKADALKKKSKQVMRELLKIKQNMGQMMRDGFFLLAQAKYAAGEFQGKVMETVKRASIRLDKSQQNIAGVLIPQLTVRELEMGQNETSEIILQRGGFSIQKVRDKFRTILDLMVHIASMQAAFSILDEKIKVTNRRVNALEHVVIPKFESVWSYIEQQLDEQAREDFYRLKKVLDNKKKHAAEEESEANDTALADDPALSQNLLDNIDTDIIF